MGKQIYTQEEIRQEWERRQEKAEDERLALLKQYDIAKRSDGIFVIPGIQGKPKDE